MTSIVRYYIIHELDEYCCMSCFRLNSLKNKALNYTLFYEQRAVLIYREVQFSMNSNNMQ